MIGPNRGMPAIRRLICERIARIEATRWFGWTWRLGVTLIVSVWVLGRLDLGQFRRILVTPNWGALGWMVCAGLVFALLGGAKVWLLLRALAPVRFSKAIGYFLVATSLGAFTPAALGDFSIAGFLRREGVPIHQGLSVMLTDRVIAIAVYALVFTPLTLAQIADLNFFWSVFAFLFALIVIGLGLNALAPVRRFVRVHVLRSHAPALEDFAKTISDLLRLYPYHLVGNLTLTLIRSIVGGIVVWFALRAAGERPFLFPVVCATNSLTIVNLLPISVGGVGIYEGSGLFLFERFGLNGANVLAALLYQRLYVWLSSVAIFAAFALFSLHRVKAMGDLARDSEGVPLR